MLLYNVFAYVSLRERAYLWHAAAIGLFAWAVLTESGLAFQHLWPDAPRWDRAALPLFLGLATAAFVPFARELLDTPLHSPRLDAALLALVGFALTQAATALASLSTSAIGYRECLVLTMLLGAGAIGIGLPAAALSVRAGQRPASYLLVGLMLLGAVSAVVVLETTGVIPRSGVTAAAVPSGIVLFLVTTSAGLNDRVAMMRVQKEVAEHVAEHDRLTGIPNRRRFDTTLATEWTRAQRSGLPLSLLMVDLDHFKSFNDGHGHLAGDACLRHVADALVNTLRRPNDAVARYGGEEFAVVLPDTNEVGARYVGERLRAAIEHLSIPNEAAPNGNRSLTVSVGCATARPVSKGTQPVLVAAADTALYRAKAGGRNRVESADFAMHRPVNGGPSNGHRNPLS